MLKLDSQINLDFAKFFHWWGDELAFLVPERVRQRFARKRACLVLYKREEGVEVVHVDGEDERHLGRFALDEAGSRHRERLFEEMPGLSEAELIFRLLPEQSMKRMVKLPAAAAENLKQVVAFEMDRLTPFRADQVYFGAHIVERIPESRQIKVELALTPRQKLDQSLDELIACGWRPDRVEVGPETTGSGLDLLPERFRPRKNKLPQILTGFTVSLFALLLLAVLLLPLLMNRSLMLELQQQAKVAGKIAKEVDSLREAAQKLEQETGFLQEKKRNEPVMVAMLNELTRVIPDQTSLYGLQYRDRKVVIQGRSPAASSLIELIEASPYFKNTSFVSPVIKDISSGQERFQIASEVINGGASEQAAQ